MQQKRFYTVFWAMLLSLMIFLSGCNQQTIAVSYEDFSAQIISSANLSSVAFDYSVTAEFADSTTVKMNGSSKIRRNNLLQIVQANDDVSFSVPEKDGNVLSKMDFSVYWADNTLYLSCLDTRYRTGSSVQNALTVQPTVLFSVPQKAIQNEAITETGRKNPTYSFCIDAQQMPEIYDLFGTTFEKLTSKTASYRYESLAVSYQTENGYVRQSDIEAVLIDTQQTENNVLHATAHLEFEDPTMPLQITPPSDFDSYSANQYFNPFA